METQTQINSNIEGHINLIEIDKDKRKLIFKIYSLFRLTQIQTNSNEDKLKWVERKNMNKMPLWHPQDHKKSPKSLASFAHGHLNL